MRTHYTLTTEFFAIPYRGDISILYSPLKNILMLVNQDVVDLVASLRDGLFTGVDGDNIDAMQLLIQHGAVNGPPDERPVTDRKLPWRPTEATLFLTNACNLRCSYCYASAGEFEGSLDIPTAVRAVEVVAANALNLGHGEFRVSYHGGGEPTLAWPALTASAERAEQLAAQHGLRAHLSLATNGVLPAWKVDWLARHVHDFSISYDGPSWLQDRYRPTVSGRGSAETVEATLRHLDSHGARYALRLTVTADSVMHLPDIVEYTLERYAPSDLHLEPLFTHGRAEARGLSAPHARAFIDHYREAEDVARRYGIELYYSGARTDVITDTFCGAPEGSFNVTPEGLLTACFEVCHPEDQLAEHFFYGRVDRATGEIETSADQLAKLAGLTVRARPECEQCFCKWHCAGDCAAKNLTSDARPGEGLKSARCTINQELSRDQLLRRLRDQSSVMRTVEANLGGCAPTDLTPLGSDPADLPASSPPATAVAVFPLAFLRQPKMSPHVRPEQHQ